MNASYASSGFYKVSEFARYANVSESTIRRAIASGALRDKRIGRCTRIDKTDGDSWLTSRPSTSELVAS